MFDLYVLKEWSVKEVARALGVTATHVYVNKHRIAGLIKKELKRLEAKLTASEGISPAKRQAKAVMVFS